MTDEPAKNFHGVGIGPLSKILAVKGAHSSSTSDYSFCLFVCNRGDTIQYHGGL